ncbi:unnamed protein product [Spirodela intermedia]|uniref:Uncharacterized protein n=1 Tax=Spirodela intermedia TaxID=51605 RepID=A0A7I8LCV4_SPIIN|nr:unnamed protein product [Spirodela intermedia]
MVSANWGSAAGSGCGPNRPANSLQWAKPTVWAPERATRSLGEKPLSAKRAISWETELLEWGRWPSTASARETKLSLRPRRTA